MDSQCTAAPRPLGLVVPGSHSSELGLSKGKHSDPVAVQETSGVRQRHQDNVVDTWITAQKEIVY